MTLIIECKPELRQYERLNKLFAQAIECKDAEGSEVADKLFYELHDLIEEIAIIAYATGIKQ